MKQHNYDYRLLLEQLELSPASDISAQGMAVSVVPILVVAIVSCFLKLGNVRTLIIAAIRCVAQLLLLGLVLYPIFRYNQAYVTFPYILFMVLVATREASVKPKHRYKGVALHMMVSISATLLVSLTVIIFGVLQPTPWYNAQTVIPVAGMMLGSCVNALSLGLDRFLVSLCGESGRQGSATLQTFQACGATRWECSLPAMRQAIETGMTPNLNQMSVMGLVSIPGMFTGQILGGTPPFIAAKYQIVIMFFVSSNSTMILFFTLLQAIYFRLFRNKNHSFQANLVSKRQGGKPKDIVLAVATQVVDLFKAVRTFFANHRDDSDMIDAECNNASAKEKVLQEGTFRRTTAAPPNSSRASLLKLTNGVISHDGEDGTPLLTDLDLELCDGEIIVLQGPSGCGKTSVLRALALLESLQSGTLTLRQPNGMVSATMCSPTAWRSQVLNVRQSGGLGLQGTPRELLCNLCALKSQTHRVATSAKETVEKRLIENIQAVDMSPEVMLDHQWDHMSGGEAQRVYLCVLLALLPTVLLLDEPTSACDEYSARKVEDLIVQSGCAVIWVSHNPAQMERLLTLNQTCLMRYEKMTATADA